MPYLTPENVPESTTCRALLIPESTDWLAIFSGALTELSKRWNWQQQGITVDAALDVVNAVIEGYYNGCVTAGCEQPGGYALLRVNAAGHVEQLIDGVWTEPTGENAFPAIPERTEPTAYERRCAAAANAANVIQELYEQVSEVAQYDLGVAEAIIRIVDGLLVYWFWIAPIINGVLLIAIGILEVILQAAKYITADVWDTTFDDLFRCLLFECSSDDGDVVSFDYDCLMAALVDENTLPPWNEMRARLAAQLALLIPVVGGVDALNQAGATTAITEADCDDCTDKCVYFLHDTPDAVEFLVVVNGTLFDHGDDGHYLLGDVTSGSQQQGNAYVDIPAGVTITGISYRCEGSIGITRLTIMEDAYVWTGSNQLATTYTEDTIELSGSYSPSLIGFQVNSDSPLQSRMTVIRFTYDVADGYDDPWPHNCE